MLLLSTVADAETIKEGNVFYWHASHTILLTTIIGALKVIINATMLDNKE